ncbi:MAG: hypothetical protein ACMUIE_01820 [Thermoplasmatota archaeon]
MKAKMLALLAVSMALLSILMLPADAREGPSEEMQGPGNGNEPVGPGPVWNQSSRDNIIGPEKGYKFRYGLESPMTSVEGADTGKGINFQVARIRFHNGTHDLTMELSGEEWTVADEKIENGLRVSYACDGTWRSGGSSTSMMSKIRINYTYSGSGENERMEFNIRIQDPPAEGTIEAEIRTGSEGTENGVCCWKKDTSHQSGEKYKLSDFDGGEISSLTISNNATVEYGGSATSSDTSVDGELLNETAVIVVGTQLEARSDSVSFTGILDLLEGFGSFVSDSADEAVDYLLDHIYSFTAGAALFAITIAVSAFYLAGRKKDTGGKDLELGQNRYYKVGQ